ncbi:divergent polysaccharide deacetylase family protein [Otariodibacter sp.]|uniref:divergent polysaccharide deacetylase family protein n=1 Tax=Otariodibacter sp. TaxID=3030919 RepID=UPI00261F4BB7|nr:divergent polysaccharide deacetylase family protein [Otariodibacter sp.]
MNKINYKQLVYVVFLQIIVFISPSVLAGQLAIVIDDIGYRNKEDLAIYELPKEVNIAIIPSAPHAADRAKKAFEQGRDILIHLPMQPKNSAVLVEAGALTVGMNEDKIKHLVEFSRVRVPYAIGLNNHMGSGATSDRKTMEYLMKVLSSQQLFFLDSKTVGDSVAYKVAKEFGVNALERNIFLDNSDELSDVQHQFNSAINYARKHGLAIMIGHPRKNSISVLKKGIAHLPSDIELVKIGTLWRNEKIEPKRPFITLFDVEPASTSVPPFESVPMLRGLPKE